MKQTGPNSARDVKGWEWELEDDGTPKRMAKDSAAIRREQASEIERETRRTVGRSKAMDASNRMGNPTMPAWAKQEIEDEKLRKGSTKAYDKAMPGYAKGGMVGKGGGMARPKKCKMY